ncbi:hypothetical protein ASPZODRAFT_17782 [Penicilliopsis zonata CBS 506.65]|uniref:DNA-directed RNA polymerase III subunit RPC3 n=1 Tax=Penicilliopsis zonata CBS 506.65 TaxID=1073090 RepID=A0A1L9SCF5_9EURO|nr:hypothetical protein ASPZODRAFT_17782 [Penicilliopsis zonata CBS 506.65]OJJ44866.1 hypothetical protein ASPZODRAFT_17782 [Penicilliopsis zonata CBS 506.65]
MTSQYATELCSLLIEDNFGELFARIFSTLQRYDRLTLPRLRFYSRLSDRQLHHGLAAMVQHHLIYHYTSLEDGNTYYETNLQSAYYLVRSGKILEMIEDRLGKYAATVMSTIMFLGHAQIAHLETLPELKPQRSHANGVGEEMKEEAEGQANGVDGEHELDELVENAAIHSTLKALAAHGYVIQVRDAQFQSPNDNVLDAQRVLKARPDVKEMKGKKQEQFLLENTERIVKERTDGDLSRGLMFNGVPQGVKRKHSQKPNEERREYVDIDEDEENEWSDDDFGGNSPMDSNLVVRVNYPKLDVALRNRRLVELVDQESSSATAQVYDCLLRRIEYQTPRCRDIAEIPREGEESEQYSVPIRLSALVDDIDPYLDLSGSIGPMEVPQGPARRGKRPLENGVHGDTDDREGQPSSTTNGTSSSSSGASRTYEVDQHLCLLAQPPYNFTSKRMIGGLINWTVEYRHLARKLRHTELERIIEARYGDVALRVVRVLHAKGKLDEKRLQEISLLPFKDLRQVLASMQAGGFVDLQEVPRDAQRQPSRTIYLWFYDPDRVAAGILEDTYKAMSRCLQRIRFERARLREFLDKTERSDVKGNEERYLSEGELKTLHQWRAKEALLLGEVSRLDDMVAVFRDY